MSEQIVEIIEEITPEHVTLVLIEIEKHGGHHGHRHPHLVSVTVDGEAKQVHLRPVTLSACSRKPWMSIRHELEEMQRRQAGSLLPMMLISKSGDAEFSSSHVRGGASS